MKIITSSSGKRKLTLSKTDWKSIGIKAGWLSVTSAIKNISFENFTIIPRNETSIMEIINGFGSKRFKLGYVKSDGSFREFEAQRKVNKYRLSPGPGGEIPYGLVVIYDLKEAQRIASELKLDIYNENGEIDERKASIKETELRNAYRRIYPKMIDLIKMGGNLWIVDNPISNEVRGLHEELTKEKDINDQRNDVIAE
jgi:hypothetical protein